MTQIDNRQLLITPEVMAACEEHCFSRVDVEVGGFLLGEVSEAEVRVTASQPAATAESGQTHLTFTHEAWDEVLSKLDSEFAGLTIVGWYHSHPGFGCFLSDYDIFIQKNFFSGPGQMALVIDPIAGTYGIFTAADDASEERESGSTMRPAAAQPGDALSPAELKADLLAAGAPRGRSSRRWPIALGVGAAAFGLGLAMGWVVVGIPSQDAERSAVNALAEQQAAAEASELQLSLTTEQLTETEQALTEAESVAANEPESEPTTDPESKTSELTENQKPPTVSVTFPIRRGDTLWSIAERFFGSGDRYVDILKWNPGIEARKLRVGDTVVLQLDALNAPEVNE